MRARGSAAVGGLLGIVVGAIALGLALQDMNMVALGAVFARAGIVPVLLGALVHVVVQVVYALRWRVLLGRAELALARMVGLVGLGYLANYTLPGRPGELVRAGLLRGLAGVPLAAGLASLLLEKVLDGAMILLAAAAFGLSSELPGWLRASMAVGAIGFVVGAVVLGIAALVPAGSRFRGSGAPSASLLPLGEGQDEGCSRAEAPRQQSTPHPSPLPEGEGTRGGRFAGIPIPGRAVALARESLAEVGEPVRGLARPRTALGVVLLGGLASGAIVAQQAMLCTGVGIAPDPRAWLLLYAALGLASALPGAPGYVGTYQYAAVLALGAFGVEEEQAFAVATLYQLSRLLGSLVVGAWAASREGLTALRIYWASKPGRKRPSSHHASSSPG